MNFQIQVLNLKIQIDLQSRWRIFVLSFLAGLLMVSLPYLGVRSLLSLYSPLPSNTEKHIDIVKTKLEKIRNDYVFKHDLGIVERSYASDGEYNLASAYGVINMETKEILFQKNFSDKLPIASLTKIMTAVVALDLLEEDESIEVTQAATEVVPTNMGLIPGQKWRLKQLMHALILTSSNDAAELMKNRVDSQFGEGTFIKAMNTKASFLGLKNTHFENPQGYDGSGHFSTVEDLSILSIYALKNYPLIGEVSKKDYQFYLENEDHKQADLYNWNGLLGVYPGIFGLKIGNTEAAQKTTIVAAERNRSSQDKKQVLVVLLGAPGVLERDLWAAELLDLGFEKLGLEKIGITESRLKEKYSNWKYF